MNVLLINGSPHEAGCTYTALSEVAGELAKAGVGTEIFHIGKEPVRGCVACRQCKKNKDNRCAFDDPVNVVLAKMAAADGLVIGSPVHFSSAAGSLVAFLDRFFFAGTEFAYKPGACVVSARRSGTTATFDQLNKYFTIKNMPVVPSQYWNNVHGHTPEDVRQDLEGLQIMRTLGRNMAWMLSCIKAGKEAGFFPPSPEPPAVTNFIRR